MSMHKKPLLPHEETALMSHGLPVGQPSQLADAFRMGMEAERERWRALLESRAAGCERAAENTEDTTFDAMARVLMSVREDGSKVPTNEG